MKEESYHSSECKFTNDNLITDSLQRIQLPCEQLIKQFTNFYHILDIFSLSLSLSLGRSSSYPPLFKVVSEPVKKT